MRTQTLSLLMAASLALLPGCNKQDDTGVSRMQVGAKPADATAQGDAGSALGQPEMPESGAIPTHAAPPLSELGSSNPHGAEPGATSSSVSGAGDPNMNVQAGQTKVMAGGNILQVAGLAFTVSDQWENVKASNPVRVAEYKLNGSGGPAEMAVFYFGKNQGGGMEDNIRRWGSQFSDTKTTEPGAQVARIEKNNLRIALVKSEGTYNPGSMGPMAPKSGPKTDYALFGLVVEGGPEGSVFIKVTGPKATIAEQDGVLETMAQSVRVSDYK